MEKHLSRYRPIYYVIYFNHVTCPNTPLDCDLVTCELSSKLYDVVNNNVYPALFCSRRLLGAPAGSYLSYFCHCPLPRPTFWCFSSSPSPCTPDHGPYRSTTALKLPAHQISAFTASSSSPHCFSAHVIGNHSLSMLASPAHQLIISPPSPMH